MRSRALTAALLALSFGCEKAGEEDEPQPRVLAGDESTAPIEVIGVAADAFECDSVAPPAEVREALGHDFETAEASFQPPAGVPAPCQYVLKTPERPTWSFDIDCRQRAIEDGAALMVHYAKGAEAQPVAVGKSGLDHSGSSLLFIDDDAPCYVRVLGPEADGRLALAELVADRLTERTAPTGRSFREVE